MEDSTKERLTGALILVAALVILVPEMLSGPGAGGGSTPAQDPDAGPPLRTYDMPLDPAAAGNERQGLAPTPRQEVAAVPPPVTDTAPPEPASEPASAAAVEEVPVPPDAEPNTAAQAPEESSKAMPKPAEQAKTPALAETKPAAQETRPAAAGGKWWVQAGVFASAENAQRLGRELKAAGIPAVVSQITAQGKQMHRVRAGPVADRSAALALQAKLAASGHKSTLVAP